MTRYSMVPLLLSALAVQADEITAIRWQGQWCDGIRDALTLTPMSHR